MEIGKESRLVTEQATEYISSQNTEISGFKNTDLAMPHARGPDEISGTDLAMQEYRSTYVATAANTEGFDNTTFAV